VSESVLDRRRNSRGRPFHTDGPFTQKAQVCMIVVWANGTERTPSLLSPGNDHSQNSTQIDRGQLGKLEQGLTSTSTPRGLRPRKTGKLGKLVLLIHIILYYKNFVQRTADLVSESASEFIVRVFTYSKVK